MNFHPHSGPRLLLSASTSLSNEQEEETETTGSSGGAASTSAIGNSGPTAGADASIVTAGKDLNVNETNTDDPAVIKANTNFHWWPAE